MNPKAKALKLRKLDDLVGQSIESIRTQYLEEMAPIAEMDGLTGHDNLLLGGCVYLNHLMCERLIDNGFNARLRGGCATFGVNKNDNGVIEYGYAGNMDILTPDGRQFDGSGFLGHCWIEIKSMDLIIDVTLGQLREQMNVDNAHRGIVDADYLLDESKVIVLRSELVARDKIISGSVGYHYAANATQTELMKQKLAVIQEAVQLLKAND